jgi:hypothetical protein
MLTVTTTLMVPTWTGKIDLATLLILNVRKLPEKLRLEA